MGTMTMFLPGLGQADKESFEQENPIEPNYSPRLFGSPPQLSSLCDMRLDSSIDGTREGATGDWYRNNVLKPAQVANFFVGRALFTGGYNSIVSLIRQFKTYQLALDRYSIFGTNGSVVHPAGEGVDISRLDELMEKALNAERTPQEVSTTPPEEEATETTSDTDNPTATDVGSGQNSLSNIGNVISGEGLAEYTEETGVGSSNKITYIDQTEISTRYGEGGKDYGEYKSNFIMDIMDLAWSGIEASAEEFVSSISSSLAGIGVPLIHSLSINQPFYTFEADWYTYINNVKMMINASIVMLGLQSARVRIGDTLYPIGMNVHYQSGTDDVWTNYRYITSDMDGKGVGVATNIDNMAGETNQYVSFMVDTVSESESYTNTAGESQIYSNVVNSGSSVGAEIAFITNSSANVVDDQVVTIASSAINAAEQVMQALSFGAGRFTAAVFSGMARSYLGDHTIYPKIFQQSSSTTGMTVSVKLRASRGDPYSYLTEVLVPLFHIFGMCLPKMSEGSAAAYQYPPIIQCQIPGIWGTRLGMITNVQVTKNPDQTGLSVNGYPMSINVSITIEDLCHVMVNTPMNQPAYFLNNQTMFDYIAQCTGVDKYRTNSAARIVTRLALASSYVENHFYDIGNAIANDFTTSVNRLTRISHQ
jgi:hypothetical protein